jgi:glycosyltransferase involved in cell wall biosynthesis
MRILYILELNAYKQSGISNKAIAQICEWEKSGHKVEVVIFSPYAKDKPVISGALVLSNRFVFSFFSSSTSLGLWINKVVETLSLHKTVNRFDPDIVYFRQTIWTPLFPYSFRKYRAVIELNSLDKFEIKHLHKIWQWIYTFGKSFVLKYVNGIIAVSNEIREDYANYIASQKLPSYVLSNSIKGLNQLPPPTNSRPILLFVGSAGMPWHGTDKLLRLAKELPEYEVWLVGDQVNADQPNFKTFSFMGKNELIEIYKKASIGIASLALHRNSMKEASPLKVREYLSYGLPVIGAYQDTDFSGQDFYLELENNEDNIVNNIGVIKKFIEHWNGKRVESDLLRSYTFEKKEAKRLAFFKEVMDGKH